MSVQRQVNPPCVRCGTETLVGNDPSGGWLECPACSHLQAVRRTTPGEGRLSIGWLGCCPGCAAAGLRMCADPPEPPAEVADDDVVTIVAEHLLNVLRAVVAAGVDPDRALRLASRALVDLDRLREAPSHPSPLHDLALRSLDDLERTLSAMRVNSPAGEHTLLDVYGKLVVAARQDVGNHWRMATLERPPIFLPDGRAV